MMCVIPMIIWYAIALAIALLAGSSALRPESPLSQLLPMKELLQPIGYGLAVAIVIFAIAYGVYKNKKSK